MPVKYYLSYINVTKVTTYPCMPFHKLNVIMLKGTAHPLDKKQKKKFTILCYFVVL